MKYLFSKKNFKTLFLASVSLFLFTTCEKPERVVKLETLEIQLADISYTSATLRGEITDLGSKPIEQHGLLISESSFPNLGQANTTEQPMGSAKTKGIFSYQFTGLKKNTTYYFRAFAVVSSVPQFGEIKQFKTKDTEVPTVTAGTISNITLTTATLNGEVTLDGGEPVTKRGLCWGTSANPTITSCLDTTINGSGTGPFTGLMHELTAGTTYYARSYAINAKGTSYNSADIPFTTQNLPEAVTTAANPFQNTTATLNGTVNANNLSSVVTFEYGTTTAYGQTATASQSPVTGNSTTNVSASITGLNPGTLYHFRVRAVSSAGTSLGGSDLTFTTLEPPVATTSPASPVANTTATLNGLVNAKNSSTTVTFEYGTTTAYGTTVNAGQSPVTGNIATPVTYNLTGLTPGETYHYRVKASSAGGQSDGLNQTFTTPLPPVSVTGAADNVTSSGATFHGTINARNSSTTVTFEYGPTASYGTTVTATPSPVTGSTVTNVSANVSGLSPSTTYHFRVVGTSAGGTVTGSDATFLTLTPPPTVTDFDGNVYNTVQIGTQIWMKENLKSTKFNDGTTIPNYYYTDQEPWGSLSTPGYVVYYTDYQYMYNGFAMASINGICPTGWHVPTNEEWTILSDFLGGESVAGGKMKESGLNTWPSPNTGATNESGFTALHSGFKLANGWFGGMRAGFWSSTPDIDKNIISIYNHLYYRIVFYDSEVLGKGLYIPTAGFSIRCLKGGRPISLTDSASSLASTSVTLNGKVNANGTSTTVAFEYGPTTAYGTEVAATQSPVSGSVPVSVSANLTGLIPNTTYHYRVKAANSGGTSNGSDMTFTTDPVDGDGNAYTTVLIGTQIWMKENLKTTRYKDGTLIPNVTDGTWGSTGTGAYCWYDNDAATYKNTYGALYNFYAVADPKGLCPNGWHIPSDSEWAALVTYLGGDPVTGGKMKEAGTLHWSAPNTGADNSSGFTALPAGDRSGGGYTFSNINSWCHFWSTTVWSSEMAYGREINNSNPGIGNYPYDKMFGFSVRCIKD